MLFERANVNTIVMSNTAVEVHGHSCSNTIIYLYSLPCSIFIRRMGLLFVVSHVFLVIVILPVSHRHRTVLCCAVCVHAIVLSIRLPTTIDFILRVPRHLRHYFKQMFILFGMRMRYTVDHFVHTFAIVDKGLSMIFAVVTHPFPFCLPGASTMRLTNTHAP